MVCCVRAFSPKARLPSCVHTFANANADVLTVDLSRPGMPVSVVRTIVPGLEGAMDSPSYLPGARVLAQATRRRT
jgi:hypothetical protein